MHDSPAEPRVPKVIERAAAYLSEHHTRAVPLAEVAAHVGLSKYHLVRRFKATLGCTPHAYLMRVRVGRAAADLAGGTSIADAAARLGFADASHFTAVFRKITGTTPGRYVLRVRATPTRG